jgi:hypothetical protein
MAEFKLIKEITNLSYQKNWNDAKLEWNLTEIIESEDEETCLCGHYPIKELCVLVNKINQNNVTVGNCCVKKFIGINSNKIFEALKKLKKKIDKSLNPEAIQYAYNRKLINKWENDFYLDIMRKRNLTEKQLRKKIEINKKFIKDIKKIV